MSGQSSSPETIFAQAIAIGDAQARTSFLDRACADDPTLRSEVERLVNDHFRAGDFLKEPVGHVSITASQSSNEQVGSLIGTYKLLEQIGEGGMGVVFMAEQQVPVRRKVAIKLIKPGMDTRQVIARFEAERQALAVMDHPNIARVLDAGTTPSDHPYFVMELVRGATITAYCDENHLPVRERLELFAALCQAIQHAHNKGIIHRDIKPTNVLITQQDGRPVVKVIDFGVAKAMGQQLTDMTLFTNFAQMIGTPLYMSPEQAERSAVDIDTRSDTYSLGVLLYELLTGSTPVDADQLKQAAFDEIRRIIREDEPPTPSARISGSRTLPSIAAHRHIEPLRLSKLVRGELDWIVMKSLEKDRNRRYETANAFAADILHYLHDEPVLACPPSAAYRFGKFARRNCVALTTAALVAGALVLGTVTSTWQAIRAERARAAEAEQRSVAEAARSAEASQRQIAEEHRKLAEAERSEAETQRAAAEANYQKAKAAVDKYFTLVSESKLFEVPGLQPLRKELLESALEFYEGAALERTSDPAILADVALMHLRLSSIYIALDRADDFIAAVRRALDAIDRLRRDYPGDSDHVRKLAGFWNGMRWTRSVMGQPRDGVGAMQTMLRFEATWQRLADGYPADVAFQSDLSYVQAMIGSAFTWTGRIKEGTAYFRKALVTGDKAFGEHPIAAQHRSGLAELLQFLANNLIKTGDDQDEALKITRQAVQLGQDLVAEFPNIPTYRSDLVISLMSLGDQIAKDQPQAAEQSLRRALELAESLIHEFPDFQTYVHIWARAVVRSASWNSSLDDASQVEAVIQKVTAAFEAQIKVRPKDRWVREELAMLYQGYAEQISGRGNFAALTERLHRRALEMTESLILEFGDQPDFWNRGATDKLGHSYRYFGRVARDSGRHAEARENFDKAVAVYQKCLDTRTTPHDAYYRDMIAETLLEKVGILASTSRADEAEKTTRQVVEMYDSLVRDYPKRADYRQKAAGAARALADRLLASGDRADEAEVAWKKSFELLDGLVYDFANEPCYRESLALARMQLAIHLVELKIRLGDAEKLHLQALADFNDLAQRLPNEPQYIEHVGHTQRYLGWITRDVGRPDDALEHFSGGIAAFRTLTDAKIPQREGFYRDFLADTLMNKEAILADSGRADEAEKTTRQVVEIYNSLVRDYPHNATYSQKAVGVVHHLARCLAARGDHAQAEETFRHAIGEFDKLAAAHPAVPDFLRIRAGLHCQLARIQVSANRPEDAEKSYLEAISSYEKVIAQFPQYGDLWRVYDGLASALDATNRPAEADAARRNMVEHAPNDAGTLNSLAWQYATSSDPTARNASLAVELAKRGIELDPNSKLLPNTLGVAHYRAGNWEDAIKWLEKSINATNGGISIDWYFLSMSQWQSGDKEQARASFAKALTLPDSRDLDPMRFRAEAEELFKDDSPVMQGVPKPSSENKTIP